MNVCRLDNTKICGSSCKKYHRCPLRRCYYMKDNTRIVVLECCQCHKLIGTRESYFDITKNGKHYALCLACYDGMST